MSERRDGREIGLAVQPLVPSSQNPSAGRRSADVVTARVLHRERGDLLAHTQELEDADAAAIAGVVAPWAAFLR